LFINTATLHTLTLSLHDALPIYNAWDFDQNFRTDESKNAFVAHPQKRKHPDFRRQYPSLKRFGLKENNRVFQYLGAPSPRNSLKDRKSTRLNSSHVSISYAVFCL